MRSRSKGGDQWFFLRPCPVPGRGSQTAEVCFFFFSLEKWRLSADIVTVFQCLKGGFRGGEGSCFRRSHMERTRGSGNRLQQERPCLDTGKKSVRARAVNPWKNLPRDMVESPSTGSFQAAEAFFQPHKAFPLMGVKYWIKQHSSQLHFFVLFCFFYVSHFCKSTYCSVLSAWVSSSYQASISSSHLLQSTVQLFYKP